MLKCIDCNNQICPKCMVQCPVGYRCQSCTQRFTSHVLKIDVWVILRSFFGGLCSGLIFAVLQMFVPIGGLILLFLTYLFGIFVGNILFKISGRKLGAKVAASITVGIIVGNICLGAPILSLTLLVFVIAVISPVMNWNIPLPGSRG